jgi:alpha-L-arabinofuranosidase
MSGARLTLDPTFTVGAVDPRIFGSFVEHMGRAVYGGIYEPGHPEADEDGWRGDVLGHVREMGVTIVRYPGGNFVSGYDWEDGIGPREERPPKLDLAWRSRESNAVGTDDFMRWARLADVEPMLAVNLGTRGPDAARALVEYCNGDPGSYWADRRVANGVQEPYGVRLWCLGNEMDGPWQMGQKTPAEYGRIAAEAGKLMRLVDPDIELVVCGSSNIHMPTFGTWEGTVLDLAWDVADYISLHSYWDPDEFAARADYLASPHRADRMIESVVATADAVAARKRSRKKVMLSYDEWNVWHQLRNPHHERTHGPFLDAPALGEDDHTITDALVVGGLLLSLLRHCDRVKVACQAQLVNVIPFIRTLDGGPAWRQPSFYPFAHAARYGRGEVLRVRVDGPTYATEEEGHVPVVDALATHDAESGTVTLFAINRGAEAVALEAVLRELPQAAVAEHLVLADDDLDAGNTPEAPDRVVPRAGSGARVEDGSLRAELAPYSWNVLRLSGA